MCLIIYIGMHTVYIRIGMMENEAKLMKMVWFILNGFNMLRRNYSELQ